MAKANPSPFALPFCAIIYLSEQELAKAYDFIFTVLSKEALNFGPVLFSDFTSYYTKEMGEDLKKTYCFLDTPVCLEDFHKIKLKTNEFEKTSADNEAKRKLNLDPGYLTEAKFVLYSVKDYPHKMYINNGIYGDVQLEFKKNTYTGLKQTYKDYNQSPFIETANKAREYFRKSMGK
jgi:hypothetical protein